MICDPKQTTNEAVDLHTDDNSFLMETNTTINSVFAPIGATGHVFMYVGHGSDFAWFLC